MPVAPARRLAHASSVLAALGLAAAALPSIAIAPDAGAATTKAASVRTDGPHSPVGRTKAPTTVRTSAGVRVVDYDLGDVEVGKKAGQFRAPVRGVLVTPANTKTPTKLVIVSHLRTEGCVGGVFAYPCPGGKEVRFDRGMTYLGEALAKQGYTVLIPDVAPVWIGQSMSGPYDQNAAWLKVVGASRDALGTAVATGAGTFHTPLQNAVDMREAGLFVHSRSGLIVNTVIDAWAKGPTRITSVLGYGAAYNTTATADRFTAAQPTRVPLLAVVGDQDGDVEYNAAYWGTEHLHQRRTAASLVAVVPGLGHNYINRALSSVHQDDRVACDGASCATAAAHERFLTATATSWFDATMKHRPTSLPLTSTSALPTKLSGLPVDWLATTNTPWHRTLFDADDARGGRFTTKGAGNSARVCLMFSPQDPTESKDRCPNPNSGVVAVLSKGALLNLKKGASAHLATSLRARQEVVMHLTPFGDRADHGKASPLTVTVTTDDGRRHTLTAPANAAQALHNRASANDNGTYTVSTLRFGVPRDVAGHLVTGIDVTAPQGGSYLVREVDAL